MAKKVDADKIPQIENRSQFHFFKFLFTGLLVWMGIQLFTQPPRKEETLQPVTIYSSLESALSAPLPEYLYSTVKIEDQVGQYDLVRKEKYFLGYVRDDAELLTHEGKDVGYLMGGTFYNKIGKKAGKLVSGRNGYDIYSFDNQKWGIFSGGKMVSLDGVVFATVGSKTALVIDSSSDIAGIIISYDYSRVNK